MTLNSVRCLRPGVFGDDALATAILDRFLHHRDVISINGPGYRLKTRCSVIERDSGAA
ncbi:ATP-binding protein [Kitasatospora sp. NPDC051853]|uniref:ATP-binding protein n=1 Tax=Kitasatospora sp. NPDC051853 TaxID=3364058 RepID=UPI0037A1E849